MYSMTFLGVEVEYPGGSGGGDRNEAFGGQNSLDHNTVTTEGIVSRDF
jgi:hypothetical protein